MEPLILKKSDKKKDLEANSLWKMQTQCYGDFKI